MTPPQAVQDPLAHAKGTLEDWNNKVKDIQAKLQRPQPQEDSPPNNETSFDQEVRDLIKKIEKAMGKME